MSAGERRGLTRRSALRAGAGGAGGAVLAGLGSTTTAGATPARPRPRGSAADLVLRGGQVLGLAPGAGLRSHEAVALRGGRVVAVGDDADMRRLVGRRTAVVDLRGRTVLPGINDSHLHGMRTGLSLPPYNVDVGSSAVASIAEVAAAVAAAVAERPAGTWIRGKGWNATTFAEGRPPGRADLDAVSPQHPVALLDWSNHQLWVNSAALRTAGITAATPDPTGGVIVRDAAGEPTGLLYETAMALVNAQIPAFTTEEQTAALQDNIALALSHGITSYTEPGMGMATRRIYEELAREGRLGVRVTGLLSKVDDAYPVTVREVRELLEAHGSLRQGRPRWFDILGVKLRADGVPIASRTAWMRKPYVGGGRGSLVTDGDTPAERVAELTRMVEVVHRAGLQIGTHATGDAAIDVVAAAYAQAVRKHGRSARRHYVIHADFAWPDTLRLLASMDCSISLNPTIKGLIADGQPEVVGRRRADYQVPYASALRAGVGVASASDSPNVSPAWLRGLETALTRRGLSGRVSGADERVGLEAALRSYTVAGARQDHAEGWKGTLEPGKVADLCVLDRRLVRGGRLAIPAGEVSEVGVDLTVVGGEVAYDAADTSARRAAAAAGRLSWAARPHPGSMCAHC